LLLDLCIFFVVPTLPQVGGLVLAIAGALVVAFLGGQALKKKDDTDYVKEAEH